MIKRPIPNIRLVSSTSSRDAVHDRLVRVDEDLQFRAAMASRLPMCVADARSDDQPLVWVNPAFERVTGYRGEDVLGVNCRFLQGSRPDRVKTRRISATLADGGTADEVIRNYRADGTPFWNHVVISPMRDHAGRLTHFVGVQADVTDRIDAETARQASLDAAQRANERLRVLDSIYRQMDERLRLGRSVLEAVPRIVTSELPGWVIAAGIDDRSQVTPVSAHHANPRRMRYADEVAAGARMSGTGTGVGPLSRAVHQAATDRRRVTVVLTPAQVEGAADIPTRALRGARGAMIVAVPLLSRSSLIGVLALLREGEGSFDAEDIAAVSEIGIRVSMALDIAGLYGAEHAAALTLQHSLLPSLPTVKGFEFAASYKPAARSAQVGGDWYDVIDLPRPGIGFAVGDVVGHDLAAAAAMGQLRSVLRSYAWSGESPPAVLRRLDELVLGLGMAALATCFFATITPSDDPLVNTVTYANAGHPPPLLRRAGGRIERLDAALTSPVGVRGGATIVTAGHTTLRPGDTLLLYTDGLVESRVRDIATGIDDLAAALAAAPVDLDAEALCRVLTSGVRATHVNEDDACLLVLRHLAPYLVSVPTYGE